MSHHHEHGHEHVRPASRHTWKYIVVVTAALAAMAIYLASMDESMVPVRASQPAAASSPAGGK